MSLDIWTVAQASKYTFLDLKKKKEADIEQCEDRVHILQPFVITVACQTFVALAVLSVELGTEGCLLECFMENSSFIKLIFSFLVFIYCYLNFILLFNF